jgi:hypothetical protein
MNYGLSYDEANKIIIGRIEGKVDAVLVKKMAVEVSEMFQKYNCNKILNDLREANLTKSIFDIYNIPRIINDSGIPVLSKRAIVVKEKTSDFKFLETASINVGHRLKIFTDYDMALDWLTQEN